MKNISDIATDASRWLAVETRDSRANAEFVFADPDNAKAAGFRPCKRCQPGSMAPEQQRAARIAQACRVIEAR